MNPGCTASFQRPPQDGIEESGFALGGLKIDEDHSLQLVCWIGLEQEETIRTQGRARFHSHDPQPAFTDRVVEMPCQSPSGAVRQ